MSWVAVGVGIATVGTGYAIYSGEEAKKKAKEQEDLAKNESAKLQAEADQAEAVSDETALQQKARARQRSRLTSGTVLGQGFGNSTPGFGSTIGGSSGGKTLLGS